MFALLVITLLVAIVMEKDTEIIQDQGQLISDNNIETTLLDNNKFE
ncbi:MAG: hypothetical protein GY931_17890 [Maribacter sp.]|nr:hypothetical protein [Maribacter sp.]